VARTARRGSESFGPRWLSRRLALLLPHFPATSVCVAFSGGADSTALLAALAQLKLRPLGVRALHVDHQLHPHSGRWSRHCARVARALGVPLAVRRARIVPTRGESPEAAARAARYRLLGAELAPGEVLVTAHHQDDQLETVLLQLMRGAGVAGLAAMPALAPFGRGVLARPLLPLTRAQLAAWLSEQRLEWVEDDSNAQLHLDRNYLRARVLPVLRERWPSAASTAARSAHHAAEAQQLLDELAARDLARAAVGARLSAQVLRTLPPARRRNALRHWITSAGFLAPSASRLEEMAGALLRARPDAQPFVAWAGARVQRSGELLSLAAGAAPAASGARPPPGPPLAGLTWDWRKRRTLLLPEPFGALALRHDPRGPLDLDALAPILTLRARAGGERLRPVLGGPRRALKSLLQEARVPLGRRARLPLLFDGERLVAAADLWLDESVQAHATSRHRARLLWRAAE
jgi:tRNA(Ile)-lysidine synthase